MKFIDKLERKFGRFGIPNLTIYMIVCYVIGYALMIVNPGILNWLSLEPAYILRGQVWRLVTSVYSAGTGMETGNLGTVSTEHFRSIMVCNCSSVLLLSNWNFSGADDWNF